MAKARSSTNLAEPLKDPIGASMDKQGAPPSSTAVLGLPPRSPVPVTPPLTPFAGRQVAPVPAASSILSSRQLPSGDNDGRLFERMGSGNVRGCDHSSLSFTSAAAAAQKPQGGLAAVPSAKSFTAGALRPQTASSVPRLPKNSPWPKSTTITKKMAIAMSRAINAVKEAAGISKSNRISP